MKKVKLKVGGITRTINAKSVPDAVAGGGSSSTKSYHYSDASWPRQKLILQVLILEHFLKLALDFCSSFGIHILIITS